MKDEFLTESENAVPPAEYSTDRSTEYSAPNGHSTPFMAREPHSIFHQPPLQRSFRLHPARALVSLFIALIFLGAVLLRLPPSTHSGSLDWSAAFFTATSAVCVTGLAVVETPRTFSFFGQVVILCLIQAGGLGYMLASTSLLVFLQRGPALRDRLLLGESLGQVPLRDTMQVVWQAVMFTFGIELVGALFLAMRFWSVGYDAGQAVWLGVFHAVSAFCNAGFDLFGRAPDSFSLSTFRDDPIVNFTIATLIIIGGLGFVVCRELARRSRDRVLRRRPLTLHTQIVLSATLALLGIGMATFLVTEWTNPNTLGPLGAPQKFLAAFFQSVTLRTAGFSTLDFGQLRSITLLIGGIGMFIGASPGGTGGGVKTTTFIAMLMAVKASLRGQRDVEIFRRRLDTATVFRALVLVFLAFTVIVVAIFALTFTEPEALREAGFRENLFMQIQFEVLSAFGTVGVSTGITPSLTTSGRWVIMILMFLGRLGPTAAAALLAAPTTPPRRWPEEKIALG